MKKNFKLVLALVLAAMMIVSSMAALADNTGREGGNPLTTKKITLTNPSAGHKYTLYQIFTGTANDVDGKATLGNIEFGNGLKLTEGKYDGKTAKELAESITYSEAGARTFANSIPTANLQSGSTKTAGTEAPIAALVWDNLSEGYYFIVDETDPLTAGDEHDLVVVQVLKDVEIEAKAGTVEFDKKVSDHNDSTQKPTVYDAAGNTSDYDVGDDVPYTVTIKLPANFSSYEDYHMTVRDKMDDGLSFNNDVVVKIGDTEVPAAKYEVKTTGVDAGETFEIIFADVKAITGADDNVEFTVTYSAKLTGNNVVYGNPGNKNEAWLTYSNNPVTGQEGGTTPHKTTVTFTYKIEVDKTDAQNRPLTGAEFSISKWVLDAEGNGSWKEQTMVKGSAGTVFTFDGLDDGRYMITETTTPEGYNTIDPIYFVVEATHGEELTDLVVTQTDANGTKVSAATKTADFSTSVESGKVTNSALIQTSVVNQSGATLPSTGGIGTTIFYVAGSIMVLAAAILLVTKRRMGTND